MPRNVIHLAESEIRAANRGRWPSTRSQYIRAAERFGCDVIFHPRPFTPADAHVKDGQIHVPEVAARGPLHRCHLHELAEACLRWEGRAPYIEPPAPADRMHEISRCIDLLEPRRMLTDDLRRRIGRKAQELAGLVDAAGYDCLTLCLQGAGPARVTLDYTAAP